MLARATQQRGDRIDELGEVIDVHLLVSELARYLTDTLNDATLHGPGLVAEALVRLSQNDGLACAANMATSPLASRLISMASVPSQLVEALTQLVELDLETMGDSGALVRDAESRAASVLCATIVRVAACPIASSCSAVRALPVLARCLRCRHSCVMS